MLISPVLQGDAILRTEELRSSSVSYFHHQSWVFELFLTFTIKMQGTPIDSGLVSFVWHHVPTHIRLKDFYLTLSAGVLENPA